MTTDAVRDARRPDVPGPVPVPAPPARRTARLMIVDGEAIVRFGLRRLLAAEPDLAVTGEAATPRDALVMADRCPPDLVVLDVEFGRGDAAGVDLARMLLERHRGLRVLVLTGCRDRDVMMRTVRLGVHGYLRKSADTADITRAVHRLLRGESVFDAGAGAAVGVDVRAAFAPRGDARPGSPRRAADAPPASALRAGAQSAPHADVLRDEDRLPARGLGGAALTERENQVLRLLAVGMSNREIGGRLVISEATVKFHVRNLRDKLEVRRRTEIVYTATRQGIV